MSPLGILKLSKAVVMQIPPCTEIIQPFGNILACVKCGSYMPLSYLPHSCRNFLRYRSDMRTEVAGNKKLRKSLPPACLQSQAAFCPHVEVVSQAVPAAASQVLRRHTRTRL